MKKSRVLLGIGLAILGLGSACSSSKEAGQGKGAQGGGDGIPELVLVEKGTWKEKSSDPFQYEDVSLRNGTLRTIVRYSGGCEEHAFELWGSPYLEKSAPPRRELFLKHDAHGDACRSVIRDTLRWDLGPLNKPVILRIEGYQEKLPYGTE